MSKTPKYLHTTLTDSSALSGSRPLATAPADAALLPAEPEHVSLPQRHLAFQAGTARLCQFARRRLGRPPPSPHPHLRAVLYPRLQGRRRLARPGRPRQLGNGRLLPRHLQPAGQRLRVLPPLVRGARRLAGPPGPRQLRRRAERRGSLLQRPTRQRTESSWGKANYHEGGWLPFQADLTPGQIRREEPAGRAGHQEDPVRRPGLRRLLLPRRHSSRGHPVLGSHDTHRGPHHSDSAPARWRRAGESRGQRCGRFPRVSAGFDAAGGFPAAGGAGYPSGPGRPLPSGCAPKLWLAYVTKQKSN